MVRHWSDPQSRRFASHATTIIELSPVFAELKPAVPPPKLRKSMRPKPKKPKAAAPPPVAGSAFPNPVPAQPATR
jgi:hypothetical protein